MRNALALLPLLVVLGSCGGAVDPTSATPIGGSPFKESITSALGPFDAAAKAIENAQVALATNPGMSNAELLASLAKARAAIQDVAQKQTQVAQQFAALAALGEKIENEKVSLQRDKVSLQRDKSDLESRERLFSMGFYASFITALFVLFGLPFRYPMYRLDKRLKQLEIREKEIALREREAKLSDEIEPKPKDEIERPGD